MSLSSLPKQNKIATVILKVIVIRGEIFMRLILHSLFQFYIFFSRMYLVKEKK